MHKEQALKVLENLRQIVEEAESEVIEVRVGQNRKKLDYVYDTSKDQVPNLNPLQNRLEYVVVIDIGRKC